MEEFLTIALKLKVVCWLEVRLKLFFTANEIEEFPAVVFTHSTPRCLQKSAVDRSCTLECSDDLS